jgi:hypothetical protein
VVAGVLKPSQHDQTDQIARVEAVGGRIHAVVQRHCAALQTLGECLPIRGVVDQSAGVEIGQ